MLFGSIVALSLASSVLAGPYKRFEGLTVELQGPAATVNSVDDLILTATVTNGGAESVKLLRYGTILDTQLPTKSFKVTKDGQDVAFTGIKLSVSLSEVDDTAFTIIPAGESVTVTHQVAPLFDFAAAGAGKYTFEPVTNFQVQDVTQHLTAFELSKVGATTNFVEVELSGDLAKRELPELNKRAVDICTTSSRKSFIDARLVFPFNNNKDSSQKCVFLATPKESLWLPKLLHTSAAVVPPTPFIGRTSVPPPLLA
ncbi:hypothetical protein C0992_000275 [Termitomyces sp. T32_za158]|nr:hypothetical protein C0992_000275 [Termitomyces sp. T32_za158]